ncbi:Calx-beta domain-containing protein [Aquabacterium sp.]|uniref:Calx-beta domain-containing protein n=1 Tax=Aquabacterium sp. TaxID=1872578 RepID=UPI002CCC0005|nr:Calx-beta domain-containing protein [Aquabacterium sp.]HSW04695.1 Calx-beta domain-containing protein [Aquabacterium sp.]
MPLIQATPVATSEGAGGIDFVITLDAAAATEVKVSYQTDIGSATYSGNQDFVYQSGTLSFAPGETSKTVRVLLGTDTTAEATEVFWLDLYSPINATVAQKYTPALIFDNDAGSGTPALSVSDAAVDEAAKTASFFVWLSRPSTGAVTVSYATANDTALAGADFSSTAGLLSFAPGEMVKTVTVPLSNDALAEPDEFFKLQLSSPTGATLAEAGGLGLISRNDADPVGTPLISARPLAVSEGESFASFVVQLNAPSQNEVRVSYQTDIGSATYGGNADYIYLSEQLVFAPGETSKTVHVAISNDTTAEAAEVFWLDLFSPVNAAVAQKYTPAVIVDNDGISGTPAISVSDALVDETAQTASFFVALNRPATTGVSVAYATADDTTQAGSDYLAANGTLNFAPGEMVKTVTLTLLDDTLAEPDEFFKLLLSDPLGATLAESSGLGLIGRNDSAAASTPLISAKALAVGESDGFASFVVQLSAPSQNEVRVSYQTDIGSATYGGSTDYIYLSEQLIFAPGETNKTVHVAISNDTTAEAAEVFWLDLFSPVNATVAQKYTPAVIVDNDGVTGLPAISISDAVVDEAAQTASFFVALNRPSTTAVTVAYATADDTTLAGSDYLAANGTLNFAPGEMVKTVTLTLQDDEHAEPDEFFKLLLSNAGGATLADGSGLGLIGRSDSAATSTPLISAKALAVGESDGFATFVVQLDAPSQNEVRVSYQTDIGSATYGGNADYIYRSEQLVFAPGETTKTVNVPITPDTVAEGTEVFWLDLYSPVNATVAQKYTPALVIDNDGTSGTPVLGISDAVVDEASQTVSFFVTLNKPSTSTVSVDYASANGSAQAGSDFLAASGRLSFAPGEVAKTVTLTLLDDTLQESNESFQLQLGNASGATLLDAAGAALIGRNDVAPISTPQITATPLVVSEADRFASFVVQLSAPARNEVRVSYQTDIGTATYGGNADFIYRSEQLVFAPGETTKLVQVPLTDDTTAETTEAFSLDLYSPINATVPQRLTPVTVLDNDGAGSLYSHGRGDDIYTIGSVLDRIAESPNGGIDTVRSSISLTLPDNTENLVLTGAALNGLGNSGNNSFRGTAANNSFDGKEGIDTVIFGGARAAYTVAGDSALRTVSGGGDGSDTLFGVERLQFADTIFAADTGPGGNVYQAYALFNAAFDRGPSTAELSLWTAQLDQLGNLTDTAQAMINHYAPGVPDEVLVAYLWGTIIETPIPLDALSLYVGLLGDGTFTQASILALVATLDYNTGEIAGIVGQTLTLDPAWFPVPG